MRNLNFKRFRSQVTAAHFCIEASGSIAPRAFAQSIAEQLTCKVEGFGNALAATLADQVQISGEVNVGLIEGNGSATGVYIKRLDLVANDEQSFDRIFREPVQKLYDSGYNKPLILLVDGLDEAQNYGSRYSTTIVRLLARLTDLPETVRIIVTTRPDPRVLKHYSGIKPFDLIRDAPTNEDDVRLFTFERLAELDDERREDLTKRIKKAAKGNFLYAHLILNDLLHRLPNLPDLEALKLPKDLSDLYCKFLNRELGADEDRWYSDFKEVLGLIAVAQGKGLSRTQLTSITGKDVDRVNRSLRICKQYLDGTLLEGPFRSFHRSFTDFLLWDEENIDYRIDATVMHSQIVSYYIREFADRWEECEKYGLHFLPTHLAEVIKLEKNKRKKKQSVDHLRKILLTFNWLQAKLNNTDIISLIADYNFLPDDQDLSLVQGALQLSTNALRIDKTQLPGQLLGRLQVSKKPNIQDLLGQIKPYTADIPWLRPLTSSLTRPGGALLFTLGNLDDSVMSLVFSNDYKNIIAGLYDGTIVIWDFDSRQKRFAQPKHKRFAQPKHKSRVESLVCLPDNKHFISACEKEIRIWDLKEGTLIKSLSEGANALLFLPTKRSLLYANERGLKAWDWNLESDLDSAIIIASYTNIKSLRVTDNELKLVIALTTGEIILWDLEQNIESYRKQIEEQSHGVGNHIALVLNQQQIFYGADDGNVSFWDLQTGRQIGNKIYAYSGNTQPNNLGSYHLARKVINLRLGPGVPPVHVRAVTQTLNGSKAISSTGSYSNLPEIKVWNVASRTEELTLKGHEGDIWSLSVTKNGKYLASGSEDLTIRIWDLESDNIPIANHKSAITALKISSGGRFLVSASQDLTIKLWDLRSGEERFTMTGHTDIITDVAITLDGSRAISSSYDCSIKVWCLQTGVQLQNLVGHLDKVVSISILPDGHHIISSSLDKTHIPQKNFDSQTINLIYIVSKLCQISITSHFVVYSDRE